MTDINLSNWFNEENDKKDLKKYQLNIQTKIAQLNDFKSRIEENTTVPSEIRTKYTQSIQLLIDRLNGYLGEIHIALGKVDQIIALEESISQQEAELKRLNDEKASKDSRIKELLSQLRAVTTPSSP